MSARALEQGARADESNAELCVELAGISASLSSEFTPFIEYAREHLAPLLSPPTNVPKVRARLRWHEGLPPERQRLVADLVGWDRADRDLYRREHRLAWFRIDELPDLHLRFTVEQGELLVEGDYYHRLGRTPRRDWLRRLLYSRSLPRLRRRRFTTLLYYLVYYPCFWWLEHHGEFHPIHAGGVELPDGIVALAGPSGVGKSTLTTGLAASPGGRLLSDTFLLHNGATVRAVPEPLLLDQWSRSWLGSEAAAALRPIAHRYSLERQGYHWPAAQSSPGGTLALLVFPQRAATHYVRRLPPGQAQGRIRAGDLIVNDLRRYWAFAAVLEVLDPNPLVLAREESLAKLVSAVPAYEVGLTADLQRTEMVELFARLLRAAQETDETAAAGARRKPES